MLSKYFMSTLCLPQFQLSHSLLSPAAAWLFPRDQNLPLDPYLRKQPPRSTLSCWGQTCYPQEQPHSSKRLGSLWARLQATAFHLLLPVTSPGSSYYYFSFQKMKFRKGQLPKYKRLETGGAEVKIHIFLTPHAYANPLSALFPHLKGKSSFKIFIYLFGCTRS